MDQFLLCLQNLQKSVTSTRKLSLIHSLGGFSLAFWACADTAPPTPQHSHYVWNRTELLALDPSRVDYLLGK